MQNINAREAQNNFGELMGKAIKSPVVIQKYNKPSAVLMSYEDYLRFSQYEDLYWALKAKEASKKGFLSKKDSEDFLDAILEN